MKSIFTFFFVLLAGILLATHNKSGEIYFEQLPDEPQTMQVTIITYTKISAVAADKDSLLLNWGDGTSMFVERMDGLGGVVGPDIKKNFYIANHTYANPGTYTVWMADLNRNAGILNVNFPNSESVPFFLQAQLIVDAGTSDANHAPLLLRDPVDIAYLQEPFTHIAHAFDRDGDSLVYSLIAPLQDLGTPVPNYQEPTEIGIGPNNQISIDPASGELIWDAPQVAGEYNIAILIKSYRNGVLRDIVIRDLQILVLDEENKAPNMIMSEMNRSTVELELGESVSIDIEAADPDLQAMDLDVSCGLFELDDPGNTNFDAITPGALVSGTFSVTAEASMVREQPYLLVFKTKDQYLNEGYASFQWVFLQITDPATSVLQPEKVAVTIYPNPVADMLELQLDPADLPLNYQLISLDGKVVRQGVFTDAQSSVPVTNLSGGTYLLHVEAKGKQGSSKVLIR